MNCPKCDHQMMEMESVIKSISNARQLYPWVEVYDMPVMRRERYCVFCDTHVELPPEIQVFDQLPVAQ